MPNYKHGKDIDVRVSDKTDGQSRINSKDGYNIKGGEQNLTGADVDIAGVSSGARLSSNISADAVNLSLDSSWNSIKNAEVSSRHAADVVLDNFVQTDVNLRGDNDSNVEITGTKRGNIHTGSGDDTISVEAQSNGSGWSNQFKLYSGSGDDTITLNGDKGITMFRVSAGFGDDVITMIGDDYASVRANLGFGDDIFTGGGGQDNIRGGRGDDDIRTGGGDDILVAGRGNDFLDGGAGIDSIYAGSGDDTIIYDANDSRIVGGSGNDTLVVNGHLNIGEARIRSIERIEMRDGDGDDSVEINMDSAQKISETDIVKMTGDAGDSVNDFDYESQLDDVTENEITFSVFEGEKGQQIWVQHGMTMGDKIVGAPEEVENSDENIGETVLLGTLSDAGSMADWGVLNDNGTVSFDKNGISGSVEAFNKNGGEADVAYSIGRSGGGREDFGIGVHGGGSDELDLNESIAVNFDSTMQSAKVGFDSLFGHFDEGSKQDARVSWEAYKDGELVASGEVINDTTNLDGDNQRETNFIEVNESFDRLEFQTVSPTSQINSNFNIRYIEAVAEASVPVEPVDDVALEMLFVDEEAGYKNTVGYYTVDEEGNISDVNFGFENASKVNSGGNLIAGESTASMDVPEGSSLEFFIIANGFNVNEQYLEMNSEEGTLSFVNADGELANITDEVPSLIFTAANGDTLELNGNIYHTNNANLNVDGQDHAVIERSDDGQSVTIGFEDLKNLGDRDFDDTVIQINVGDKNVNVGGVSFGEVEVEIELPEIDAIDDTFTVVEDGILQFNVSDILANDIGEELTITSVTSNSLAGGVISFDAVTGIITFTPAENYNGSDSFNYTITDDDGNVDTATIQINVTPVNDAPVAVDDTLTTNEDVALAFKAADLVANDTDIDGDTLSVTAVDAVSASGAVITFDAVTGDISYDPVANFNGDDTFSYTVSDGNGGTSTATVTIAVAPVNDAPVAVDDTLTTNEDVALAFKAADLVANDTDIDGDTLSVTAVDAVSASGAVITFDAVTGDISYDPVANFNGDDTFSYTVSDGNGGTSTATVTIAVAPVFDAPVAHTIYGSAVEDGAAIVMDGSVDNVDGGQLFYTLSSAPDEGTVINNSDGTFTFNVGRAFQNLDSGETRDVRFSYQVTDMQGNFSVADAIITVAGINDAPTASDSDYTATEDTITTVTGNFIVNDVDIEPLTITLLNQLDPQTEGTVVNHGDGTFTFTPAVDAFNYLNAGEEVTFSVSYDVSDGDASSTANLNFTVTGVNDATVVTAVVINNVVDNGQPVIVDIISAVSDPDGLATLTIAVPTPPNPTTEGTLVDNGNGTFTFTPAPALDALNNGATQNITFNYTVTDALGNVVTETVTIVVTGINDAPVAQDVFISTPEDNSVVATFNATDVDTNDVLSYSLVTTPNAQTEGVVSVGANGQFSFTPAAVLDSLALGEERIITFSYKASDGIASDIANVTVTVVGTNDKPVIADINMIQMEEQAPQTIDIKPFLSDVDSDDNASTLTYTIGTASKGALTDLGGGLLQFDTLGAFDYLGVGDTANINVILSVTDSHGAVTNKNIIIRVLGENDAPTAEAVSATVSEDGSMNLIMPVSDIDGDSLTVTFVNAPATNVLDLSMKGLLLTATPGEGLQYLDNGETVQFDITYNVSDGSIVTQNVLTLTVIGQNDAPVIADITQTMLEDAGSVTGSFTGFDYEGDNIIYLVQTPPLDADGFVTINNINGTFTFNVNQSLDSLQLGETKVISFTYVATDGKDTSAAQTVQITVQGQNDAPVLTDVSVSVGEDDGLRTFSLGVSDVDNSMAELSFTLDTPPSGGVVILNNDGTFSFAPGSDFQALNLGETANVQFAYTVSDGIAVVSKIANITIIGSNDTPVINALFFESAFQTIERYEFSFDINDAIGNLGGTEVVTFTDLSGNPTPSWLTYNTSTMEVSAKPPANAYGEYGVIMTINDGSTLVTQNFTLFVNRNLESLDVTAKIYGSNNDNVTGTAAGEYIAVNDGNDIVNAGAGNDTIFGGKGNDILNGGDGNDTFLMTGVDDGLDIIDGGAGYDKIVFHESFNKTFIIDGDFSMATNSIEEYSSSAFRVNITNGAGNDVIDFTGVTLDGNFRIYGGSGNDTITGTSGNDYLSGNNGDDIVYGGLGNDELYGAAGNDTLFGGEGNDKLYGSSGDDTLYGGAGNDYFDASVGADKIFGGAGNDSIRYNSSDVLIDGGVGDFDTILVKNNIDIDFSASTTIISNIEAIDLSFSNYTSDITLSLNDVLDMKDTSIDTLYILGDNGDNVTTGGDFSVATRIDVVDTNGDGLTDSTFQVYASVLQSNIYIGIEIGVGMTLDGTIV